MTLRLVSTASIVVALACLTLGSAHAVTIDMVTVGDAGNASAPWVEGYDIGFRLAGPVAVPEPFAYAMALAGLAWGGYSMWRRRSTAARKSMGRIAAILLLALAVLSSPVQAGIVITAGAAGASVSASGYSGTAAASATASLGEHNTAHQTKARNQEGTTTHNISDNQVRGADVAGIDVSAGSYSFYGSTGTVHNPESADDYSQSDRWVQAQLFARDGSENFPFGPFQYNGNENDIRYSLGYFTYWTGGSAAGYGTTSADVAFTLTFETTFASGEVGLYWYDNDTPISIPLLDSVSPGTHTVSWSRSSLSINQGQAFDIYMRSLEGGGLPAPGGSNPVAPQIPEPSTYCMALAGIACGGFSMWRRRKRA